MSFRIEGIVRPFTVIDSQPIQRIFRRPPPAPAPDPATIEWGDGSRFLFPPQSVNAGDSTTRPPRVEFPEDDITSPQRTWTELSRETSELRVENPEDPDQFVVVERIEQMTMQDSQSGDTVLLVFRNPNGGDGLLPPELSP